MAEIVVQAAQTPTASNLAQPDDPDRAPLFAQALEQYYPALIRGDLAACQTIVQTTLASGVSVFELYQRLLQPALYRVGEGWARNHLSVATEHMATAITESLLNEFYPRLIQANRTGRTAVLTPTLDELHQVGVKMAADVFEYHGWDSVVLGAGTDLATLLHTLTNRQAAVVGISFTIGFHAPALQQMLVRIRQDFPGLPIWLGGQGLAAETLELEHTVTGVRYIRSLDELDRLLHHYDSETLAY